MLGKISVGVRKMTTGLRIRMSSAKTINVYGRFRATLTIHMLFPRLPPRCSTSGQSWCAILYETYSIVFILSIRCLSRGKVSGCVRVVLVFDHVSQKGRLVGARKAILQRLNRLWEEPREDEINPLSG
jgi:hypothetical protein